MNNDLFSQPTHVHQHTQQPPLPLGQPLLQPAQSNHSALWDQLQQSHVQAPPAFAHNPQRMVLQPPEQSELSTDYDHSSQWQRPQHQHQHQYTASLPVAQLPPQLAAQPGYNPCQLTEGYHRHHIPHTIAAPQPQLPDYSHLQPQQQQPQEHMYHTPLQHLIPAKRPRLDRQDLNTQAQYHVPPPPLALNTTVYPSQNQISAGRWINNAQLNTNEEDPVGNHGGTSIGGDSAMAESISGNRGEIIAGGGRSGSHIALNGGDGQGVQSRGGVHAHGLEGNFGGVASTQAGGCNQFSDVAAPATVPMATQFEGAQCFTITGHPIMTNIGMNTGVHNVTTVNHYGGTYGLKDMKEFVSFTALYNSSAQDPHRRCHPGTRENVLIRLRNWIDNPNTTHRIFWLYGPAGAGKSAIAQTIAHGYHQEEVAATFFFLRSDSGRNDGNRLFPTIAWQLAFSIPATKNFIVHALDNTPHLPMTDVETQFKQLVAQIFQPTNNIASQMRHPAPVVIVDGIDECLDEELQRRILAVIGNAVKDLRHGVPLRFLIASRPEALIEESLNQFQEFTLHIDLATLDDSDHDIEKYLIDKFSVIASNQDLAPPWPGQEVIEEIVFKSSGNFILASTLIRYIGDEDYSAESQLDIVRKLKPHGTMSPFALLDALYLEILKQPREQDFLKTFLDLLVCRSSVDGYFKVYEDDAMLMNVSEQQLHIKLRRMRSLLKFEPFIDIYHKSFLDFLHDASRSGQYHVSQEDKRKRYLELVVKSVVRHVSMAIEQPNCHGTCPSNPRYQHLVRCYPPRFVLPIEDWQEALKPLLVLQDKLLKTSKPPSCRVTQVMRELQLHLTIMQESSHGIAVASASESNNNETVTARSPTLVTEAMQNITETDLPVDRCLSGLLSCLQTTNSLLAVNTAIIERMSSLLAFDPAEIAARVLSITDAQKLIDIVDLLTYDESLLSQCARDAPRKTCLLVSEIFARVPVLPQFLFLNGPTPQNDRFRNSDSFDLEYICSSAIINRILGYNFTLPTWFIYQGDKLELVDGDVNEKNESISQWIQRANPDFVSRIRVMLEVARTIRYLDSMDVIATLDSFMIRSSFFTLDSNLRAKIVFRGAFSWQIREKSIFCPTNSMADFTYESHITAFAHLFQEICFDRNEEFDDDENISNGLVKDARQLIEWCHAMDPKSRSTIKDIVGEMETWNLS